MFHTRARALGPGDHIGDVRRAWDDNARELFALAGEDDAAARRVLALDRFAGAFLAGRRGQIEARAAAGCVRDGHGDLRAEHVVLEDPPAVVDRLEFDARLREIDVADDLAFLLMDLERLGAADAARPLVDAYREAGGDPGSVALLSFYGAYRALVRVKVALLRAAQLGDGGAAGAARGQARELLALAERFGWRARGPLVLAVSGPPASWKSTLAEALARRSGWPLLSSDALRARPSSTGSARPPPSVCARSSARRAPRCATAGRVRARPPARTARTPMPVSSRGSGRASPAGTSCPRRRCSRCAPAPTRTRSPTSSPTGSTRSRAAPARSGLLNAPFTGPPRGAYNVRSACTSTM